MSTSTASNLPFDHVKLPSVFFPSGIPEQVSRISLKRDKRLNNQKMLMFIASFKKGLD